MRKKARFQHGEKGAALAVRTIFSSKSPGLLGIVDDGEIKVGLRAGKNDPHANEELIHFLCEILEAEPAQIEIIAGAKSDLKLISIVDMEVDRVNQIIGEQLGQNR